MYTETEILAKQALSRSLKLSGAFLLDDVAAIPRPCQSSKSTKAGRMCKKGLRKKIALEAVSLGSKWCDFVRKKN